MNKKMKLEGEEEYEKGNLTEKQQVRRKVDKNLILWQYKYDI